LASLSTEGYWQGTGPTSNGEASLTAARVD
jgi:hypothetical protein